MGELTGKSAELRVALEAWCQRQGHGLGDSACTVVLEPDGSYRLSWAAPQPAAPPARAVNLEAVELAPLTALPADEAHLQALVISWRLRPVFRLAHVGYGDQQLCAVYQSGVALQIDDVSDLRGGTLPGGALMCEARCLASDPNPVARFVLGTRETLGLAGFSYEQFAE